MTTLTVVAEYRSDPSEGIQVVSRTLVDGLRNQGHQVDVIEPDQLFRRLPQVIRRAPTVIVFTHGPGRGVVLASALLRRLTRSKIIWVATRPDLAAVPGWLSNRRTAHGVIANRHRDDLSAVAPDARFLHQFIGIDPQRLEPDPRDPFSTRRVAGVPLALHVGHLRKNRGLDLLAETKRRLGDQIDIVVQGSPTFPPDPEVVEMLARVGIHVSREFVPKVSSLYRAADLYLFPVATSDAGAIDLPLSVLEAVACGCPVVSTNYGALPAAFENTEGVCITDPSGFVDAVTKLLTTPGALRRRASGLPSHLHAARTTEAVIRLSEGLNA